jgi:hypothetical protein
MAVAPPELRDPLTDPSPQNIWCPAVPFSGRGHKETGNHFLALRKKIRMSE